MRSTVKGSRAFNCFSAGTAKPIYAVFDYLYQDGSDLRGRFAERQAWRAGICVRNEWNFYLSRGGLRKMDLTLIESRSGAACEGGGARISSAPYIAGRSTKWLKVKVRQEEEFVVAGYTAPSGSRKHFGALLLGGYRGRELHYVGKVGTGFAETILAALFKSFQSSVQAEAFSGRSAARKARHLHCAATRGPDRIPGVDRRRKASPAGISRFA